MVHTGFGGVSSLLVAAARAVSKTRPRCERPGGGREAWLVVRPTGADPGEATHCGGLPCHQGGSTTWPVHQAPRPGYSFSGSDNASWTPGGKQAEEVL